MTERNIVREKILQSIREKGLTMRKLSTMCGKNSNFIRDIVRGRKKVVSSKDLKIIALALGMTEGQLQSDAPLSEQMGVGTPIPVLGEIPAGNPTWIESAIEPMSSIPGSEQEVRSGFFALRVCGDSMSPRYLSGDILVFKPINIELPLKDPSRPSPRATFDALVNKFVAVVINGEATIKQLKIVGKARNEYEIHLTPINTLEYDTIVIQATDECRFQGVVDRVSRTER